MILLLKKTVNVTFLSVVLIQLILLTPLRADSSINSSRFLGVSVVGFAAALAHDYYKEPACFKNMKRTDIRIYLKKTLADLYGAKGVSGIKKSYKNKPAVTAFGHVIAAAFFYKIAYWFMSYGVQAEQSAGSGFSVVRLLLDLPAAAIGQVGTPLTALRSPLIPLNNGNQGRALFVPSRSRAISVAAQASMLTGACLDDFFTPNTVVSIPRADFIQMYSLINDLQKLLRANGLVLRFGLPRAQGAPQDLASIVAGPSAVDSMGSPVVGISVVDSLGTTVVDASIALDRQMLPSLASIEVGDSGVLASIPEKTVVEVDDLIGKLQGVLMRNRLSLQLNLKGLGVIGLVGSDCVEAPLQADPAEFSIVTTPLSNRTEGRCSDPRSVGFLSARSEARARFSRRLKRSRESVSSEGFRKNFIAGDDATVEEFILAETGSLEELVNLKSLLKCLSRRARQVIFERSFVLDFETLRKTFGEKYFGDIVADLNAEMESLRKSLSPELKLKSPLRKFDQLVRFVRAPAVPRRLIFDKK